MEGVMLRAAEPADLDVLYRLENDQDLWHLSHTQLPFSKAVLAAYLQSASEDIYTAKQYRYIIAHEKEGDVLGCVDLFDFHPMHRRAGVGIVLLDAYRGKGIGKKALALLEEQAFGVLQLHQLYANFAPENEASQALFQSMGYSVAGVKKQWNFSNNAYHDEVMVQKIYND